MALSKRQKSKLNSPELGMAGIFNLSELWVPLRFFEDNLSHDVSEMRMSTTFSPFSDHTPMSNLLTLARDNSYVMHTCTSTIQCSPTTMNNRATTNNQTISTITFITFKLTTDIYATYGNKHPLGNWWRGQGNLKETSPPVRFFHSVFYIHY